VLNQNPRSNPLRDTFERHDAQIRSWRQDRRFFSARPLALQLVVAAVWAAATLRAAA